MSFAREEFIVNPNVGWFVFIVDAFNVGKIKILPGKDMFPLQHRVFTVKVNGVFPKKLQSKIECKTELLYSKY